MNLDFCSKTNDKTIHFIVYLQIVSHIKIITKNYINNIHNHLFPYFFKCKADPIRYFFDLTEFVILVIFVISARLGEL